MDSLNQLADELDVEPSLLKEAIREAYREENLEAIEHDRVSNSTL